MVISPSDFFTYQFIIQLVPFLEKYFFFSPAVSFPLYFRIAIRPAPLYNRCYDKRKAARQWRGRVKEFDMRFQIMQKHEKEPEEAYRLFFETNDIDEAKDFAMRLAFIETNAVYVYDTVRRERVRDFDAAVYR